MRISIILLTLIGVLTLACTAAPAASPSGSGGVPTPSGDASPAIAPAKPPIISEEQAARFANFLAGRISTEYVEARLMTIGEYQAHFAADQSNGDTSLPVWVVLIEVSLKDIFIFYPRAFTPEELSYTHKAEVIDASVARHMTGEWLSAPIDLDEANLLDPDDYGRYPAQVSMSYAKEIASFPVVGPEILPNGFNLKNVSLDYSALTSDLIESSETRVLKVVQEYVDNADNSVFLIQASGSVWDSYFIEQGQQTEVGQNEAWQGQAQNGGLWLTWTGVRNVNPPDQYFVVTHLLYSPSDSVTPDDLRQIAASLPPGEPPPAPTPTPVSAASIHSTPPPPTPAPTPGRPSSVGGDDAVDERTRLRENLIRTGCDAEGMTDERREENHAFVMLTLAQQSGDDAEESRWQSVLDEIRNVRERRCTSGHTFTVSGPTTSGWTLPVKGLAITLPDDAYVDDTPQTIFECVAREPQPACPQAHYGVKRGESEILYNYENGDIYYVNLPAGEHEAFAFFDGILDWRPPEPASSDMRYKGILMMSGEMVWTAVPIEQSHSK